MIEKATIEKEFFNFMDNHDVTWASVGKVQPLAILQIYYMLTEILQGDKAIVAQRVPLEVEGESEFLQAVNNKDSKIVWEVLDDLMDTLKVTNPRVYSSVINRITSIDAV